MRNASMEIAGHAAGSLAGRSSLLAVALAGALVACGKGNGSGSPGGPGAPTGPTGPTGPTTPAQVTLQSLTVDPPTASIGKGLGAHFTAIGHYSDGSTAILPFATWSSSDDLVATISEPGIGLAQCNKAGPATITATDPGSGLTGTALLTVTPPTLQSVELSPSVATIIAGFSRDFALVGRYSDGTSSTISAATWSCSDSSGAYVTSTGGHVAGTNPGGPVTLTATDPQSGLSSTASITVAPVPGANVVSANSSGTVDATGPSFNHVTGLTAGAESLVTVSTSAALADPTALAVEVDGDASFNALVCRSWAGGPACRAGAVASSDMYVAVKGPSGTPFTLDVSALPIKLQGQPLAGSTATETYFKIDGLTPAAPITIQAQGLDVFGDVYVYDLAQPVGIFGSDLVCSTARVGPFADKSCNGAPLGSSVYVTVEGWLTAAGTGFTVTAN